MLSYNPSPKDTSKTELSAELLELTEKMTENCHEVWAKGRVKEGWTYGPVRDDAKKETPCLVPYAELPESEKEYDRNTSMETLKLIVSLGFEIKKATQNGADKNAKIFISYKSEQDEQAEAIKALLKSAGYECWKAPQSIPTGKSYADEIEKAIRDCGSFIILLSDESMRSPYCIKELDRAISHGKHVIPLIITKNLSLTDAIEFYLTDVQMKDACEGISREEIVDMLNSGYNREQKYTIEPCLNYRVDDFLNYDGIKQKTILKCEFSDRKIHLENLLKKVEKMIEEDMKNLEENPRCNSFIRNFSLSMDEYEEFERFQFEFYEKHHKEKRFSLIADLLSEIPEITGRYDELIDEHWFTMDESLEKIPEFNNKMKILIKTETPHRDMLCSGIERFADMMANCYCPEDVIVFLTMLFIAVYKSGLVRAKSDEPKKRYDGFYRLRYNSQKTDSGKRQPKQGLPLEKDPWLDYFHLGFAVGKYVDEILEGRPFSIKSFIEGSD